MEIQPQGHAIDKEFPDIIYVPETSKFSMITQVCWCAGSECMCAVCARIVCCVCMSGLLCACLCMYVNACYDMHSIACMIL